MRRKHQKSNRTADKQYLTKEKENQREHGSQVYVYLLLYLHIVPLIYPQ